MEMDLNDFIQALHNQALTPEGQKDLGRRLATFLHTAGYYIRLMLIQPLHHKS